MNSNWLNLSICPLLRKSAFALSAVAGMAAFAGSGSDAILGKYTGNAFIKIVATVDGINGPFQELPTVDNIAMEFTTGNLVSITGLHGALPDLPGVWKKKGSKYIADFSKGVQEQLVVDLANSDAKASAKYKKITVKPGSITGRVRVKRTYRANMIVVHQNDSGVFGALREVAP